MEHLKKIGVEFTVNKSDLTLFLPKFGSTIYLETYHDPDAIVSFEVAHAVVDELDTLGRDNAALVWKKVAERVRQRCKHHAGNTLGCVTTPDQGTAGFCFETWGHGERISEGYHYIKAGTRSNKFLPAGYADQIAKNYDPIMAEAFLDGGWVSFTQNKVYHFFSRERHHTNRRIDPADSVIHIGLDFNIGGCCAVAFLIENNNPVAVDEFVSYDTRDFVNNLSRYKGKRVMVYPDASGRSGHTNAAESDVSIIEKAGFTVLANDSNPAVRDRVNAVNGLLAHDRLTVNTDMCSNFTLALESQGYNARGEPEKWDKHPAIDDWCFAGDTMIIVNGEKMPISLAPSEGFTTGADGNEIAFFGCGVKGCDWIYQIQLNDGTVIKSTGDHEFLTVRGWVKAADLFGETLCDVKSFQKAFRRSTESDTTKEQTSISIKRLGQKTLQQSGGRGEAFTVRFGRTLTVKYLMGMLSTTLMKTKAIIKSKTLRLCCAVNIIQCTLLSGIKKILIIAVRQLKKIRINAANGTHQNQVPNGIGSITKTTSTCFTNRLRENVNNAGKNTKQSKREEISIAQKTAHQRREEIAELMMLSGLAGYAKKSSGQTNIPHQNTAVKRVSRMGIKELVYCLTTNEGAFSLANGVVVSNCDSAGYYIAHRFPINTGTVSALRVSGGL